MAAHSSSLSWGVPWTEDPGGPQSMRPPRVGHHWRLGLTTQAARKPVLQMEAMSSQEKTSSLKCEQDHGPASYASSSQELSFSERQRCVWTDSGQRKRPNPARHQTWSEPETGPTVRGCGRRPVLQGGAVVSRLIIICVPSILIAGQRSDPRPEKTSFSFLCVCFTWRWKMIHHVPERQHWNALATGNVCSQHEDVACWNQCVKLCRI